MLVNLPYTLAGYLPWTLPTGPPACISVSRESPEQRPGRGTAQHPLGWKSPARTELSQPTYPIPSSARVLRPAQPTLPPPVQRHQPAYPIPCPALPYHHTPGYLPRTVPQPPHQPAYPIPSYYTRPAGGPTSHRSATPLPSGLPYTRPSQKLPTPPASQRPDRSPQPAYPIPPPLQPAQVASPRASVSSAPRLPPRPAYPIPHHRQAEEAGQTHESRGEGPPSPTGLPYTAARPKKRKTASRQSRRRQVPPTPSLSLSLNTQRVLPVRLASGIASGLSLGNLGEEGLTLSRS